MTARVPHLLLVDDDEDDRELMRQAFQRGASSLALHMVESGEEALRFLRRQPPHLRAPRVSLVLLDLNMPGMHGKEVLRELKSDPYLRAIPVVILTTSRSEADIRDAYQLQAAAYVVKPVDFDEFVQTVRGLQSFWGHTASLPPLDELP